MNGRSYCRIATIGATRSGLYLALEPSHQFLHPPLLIPWSEIEAMPPQASARCAFRIKATATKLRVEGTAAEAIQRFMPGDGPHLAPPAA